MWTKMLGMAIACRCEKRNDEAIFDTVGDCFTSIALARTKLNYSEEPPCVESSDISDRVTRCR